MEAQIATGTHHGPGFDVPAQGLHMRIAGADAQGRDACRGTIDTSMGVVSVERIDGAYRAWGRHGSHTPLTDERHDADEAIVSIPEQFVAITLDGDAECGTIRSGDGDIPFRDRRETD